MTNDKQPRPGVPVPPESLAHGWANRFTTVYEDLADAAAWGADEQLRICHEWLDSAGLLSLADKMKRELRPKPPSIKQEALGVLSELIEKLRKAVEALPDD
jgi:hypothetical protein